jgi:hypothetical protein
MSLGGYRIDLDRLVETGQRAAVDSGSERSPSYPHFTMKVAAGARRPTHLFYRLAQGKAFDRNAVDLLIMSPARIPGPGDHATTQGLMAGADVVEVIGGKRRMI